MPHIRGFYHIPPDPISAAGPNHVVCIVNTSIEWYTKSGTLLGGKRLGKNSSNAVGSFFESLSPISGSFDPKVQYDQYAGRFVVIALEQKYVGPHNPSNASRILVAVSATNDPTGSWYFAAIDSKVNITTNGEWADYPGLAVSDDAVYVTANMFSFGTNSFQGTRLWIIQKGQGTGGFYDGGSAAANIYDPSTAAGLTGPAFTLQPAVMYGSLPSGVKTYLVNAGWSDGGANDYLSVISVGGTTASPTFSNTFISLGGNLYDPSAAFPNAPQLGSAQLISTNDGRVLKTVCRGGELWGTMTVVPLAGATDAGQATAFWFKILVSTMTLGDIGYIYGEDIGTGTYTFFPSLAVDGEGNMVAGFSASGPTIYPGAYFTYRFAGDAAGTTRGSGVLRAGLDYYVRKFSGTRNRWGDYSGTTIDPADDSFWIFNEFAKARGDLINGEDGRWRTAFGHFYVPLRASVKLMLEGPFDVPTQLMRTTLKSSGILASHFASNQIPGLAVDSITIGIRAAPSGSEFDKPAWLLKDGTIRAFSDTTLGYVEFGATPGDYYIVVRHRNHLAIMSNATVALNASLASYDFTSSMSSAFGTNPMKAVGSRFAMYAGDANNDGQVTSPDFDLFNPKFRSAATGYEVSDWNMDGQVTSPDFDLFNPNFRAAAVTGVPN